MELRPVFEKCLKLKVYSPFGYVQPIALVTTHLASLCMYVSAAAAASQANLLSVKQHNECPLCSRPREIEIWAQMFRYPTSQLMALYNMRATPRVTFFWQVRQLFRLECPHTPAWGVPSGNRIKLQILIYFRCRIHRWGKMQSVIVSGYQVIMLATQFQG